jgi:methylase of polypeptide subunit release factors
VRAGIYWLRAHSYTNWYGKERWGNLCSTYLAPSTLAIWRYGADRARSFQGGLPARFRETSLIEGARQDTAASITHLVRSLQKAHGLPPELRLLDLCTGTGCIPLLFQHELYSMRDDVSLRALGVDVSNKALKLARHNHERVQRSPTSAEPGKLAFMKADVLINPFAEQIGGPLPLKAALNFHRYPPFWDILVSNPPYISPSNYWTTTTRSVRGYEPKLALVPPSEASQDDTEQGDLFYPRLLRIAQDVEAKLVLLEVADLAQALRVAGRAQALDVFDGVEIWREEPGAVGSTSQLHDGFSVIGEGNARSVLCWRGIGASWLGKSTTSVSPDEIRSTPQVTSALAKSNVSTAPRFDHAFLGDSQLNSPAKPMRVAFFNRRVKGKD